MGGIHIQQYSYAEQKYGGFLFCFVLLFFSVCVCVSLENEKKNTKKLQKLQKLQIIQKIQDIQNIQYSIVVHPYLNHDDELPSLAPGPAPGMYERPAGLDLVHRHHQVALGNVDPLGARVRRHQHLFVYTTSDSKNQSKSDDDDKKKKTLTTIFSKIYFLQISTAENKTPYRYFPRCSPQTEYL